MSFYDWLYSIYPDNSVIDGRWGTLHIITVVLCVLLIAGIWCFNKKSLKTRQNIILVFASLILLFELSRRAINVSRGIYSINHLLVVLLPRPWCAISCWTVMLAAVVKRKRLYNLACMCALLNAIIFFAYPSVGFNHSVILFENLYSITTHALLLISSISMMSLELTDFSVNKHIYKETLGLACMFVYAFVEIYILKIEKDPMYFLADNDVQAFLGVDHTLYLFIYVGFLAVYFSLFYIVQHIIRKCKK